MPDRESTPLGSRRPPDGAPSRRSISIPLLPKDRSEWAALAPGHDALSIVSETGASKPGAGSRIELDGTAICRHNPFNRHATSIENRVGLRTRLGTADF